MLDGSYVSVLKKDEFGFIQWASVYSIFPCGHNHDKLVCFTLVCYWHMPLHDSDSLFTNTMGLNQVIVKGIYINTNKSH